MRAWLDLVGAPQQTAAQQDEDPAKPQGEMHRLNARILHSEGFLLVSQYMARTIMNLNSAESSTINQNKAYDSLGREIWIPHPESSYTTCKYIDPAKALIRSIQVL